MSAVLTSPPSPALLLARAVAASLNHLLASEPAARDKLAPHAGKHLRLSGALPFTLAWRVVDAAHFEALPAGQAEPVQLHLQVQLPKALQALAEGHDPAAAVALEGDADFAAAMGWLGANLRWEFEEDLARVVGDAAAYRIGRVLRGVARDAQQAAGDTGQMLRQGFAQGQAPLVGQAAYATFRTALMELRDGVARLEKRIELLERRGR